MCRACVFSKAHCYSIATTTVHGIHGGDEVLDHLYAMSTPRRMDDRRPMMFPHIAKRLAHVVIELVGANRGIFKRRSDVCVHFFAEADLIMRIMFALVLVLVAASFAGAHDVGMRETEDAMEARIIKRIHDQQAAKIKQEAYEHNLKVYYEEKVDDGIRNIKGTVDVLHKDLSFLISVVVLALIVHVVIKVFSWAFEDDLKKAASRTNKPPAAAPAAAPVAAPDPEPKSSASAAE